MQRGCISRGQSAAANQAWRGRPGVMFAPSVAAVALVSFTLLAGCGDDGERSGDGGADGGAADGDVLRDASGDAGRDAECLESNGVITLAYDFETGKQGWRAGFSDLPEDPDRELYELESGIRTLPSTLSNREAFFVASHNRSDDIWMFLARRLTPCEGVVPGRTYRVDFTLTFASNAGEDCVGIGGAPGESVYLKVGASAEPAEIVIEDGDRAFSLAKGNQSQAGSESTLAGNIASPENSCTDASRFALLHREVSHRFQVTATEEGELTVFVGTDSGFEGYTPLYYDSIRVELTPAQ